MTAQVQLRSTDHCRYVKWVYLPFIPSRGHLIGHQWKHYKQQWINASLLNVFYFSNEIQSDIRCVLVYSVRMCVCSAFSQWKVVPSWWRSVASQQVILWFVWREKTAAPGQAQTASRDRPPHRSRPPASPLPWAQSPSLLALIMYKIIIKI